MSFHALQARDLEHITGSVRDGAVQARLNGQHDLSGLHDREYVEVAGIEGRNPVFTTSAAQLPGGAARHVSHGAVLVIYPPGETPIRYTVRGVVPDGHGAVTLVLQEGDA